MGETDPDCQVVIASIDSFDGVKKSIGITGASECRKKFKSWKEAIACNDHFEFVPLESQFGFVEIGAGLERERDPFIEIAGWSRGAVEGTGGGEFKFVPIFVIRRKEKEEPESSFFEKTSGVDQILFAHRGFGACCC